MSYQIIVERPDDAALIEPLHDRTFGIGRYRKTVYRLREGLPPLPQLCLVAVHGDGGLLASIRYWPIAIETTPAILLGPLSVEPALQGRGMGKALVRESLNLARRLGHRICVVVGEPDYYRPYGFRPASSYGLIMPGPVEPERFQALELAPGALETLHGCIGRAAVGLAYEGQRALS
jgi:predicted N-acetyltransferase YhbS